MYKRNAKLKTLKIDDNIQRLTPFVTVVIKESDDV